MSDHEMKLEFANRLNFALDKQGIPRKGKGRQDVVATMFGVSIAAARKWLEGEAFPETGRMKEISDKLNVSFEWLISGSCSMSSTNPIALIPNTYLNPFPNLKYTSIPIIQWDQAHCWKQNSLNLTQHDKWLCAYVDKQENYYSLIVNDNSFEPIFPINTFLIIRTDLPPNNHSKIIVWWEKTNQTSCYSIVFDGPNQYLFPIKTGYKSIHLESENAIQICGVVRQIFIEEPF